MRKIASRVRTQSLGRLFPFIFRRDSTRSDLIRIGTDYGGWWVPDDLLGDASICYCVGVGTDISFDLGVIERFGCKVWAFDPTPRSIEWVASQETDEKFVFVPRGLAKEDAVLRFYEPENPDHVSYSLTNLQQTDRFFEAPCSTVQTVMHEFGHEQVALLKLDVEGAQHDVIRSLLTDQISPTVLCVEFDQPEPLSRTRATVKALRAADYELVNVDWFNMTFVRRPT